MQALLRRTQTGQPSLTTQAGKGGWHGRVQICTHGLQGGGGAAEHGGVVAAGGTSLLEVQRRMTCGAYVQVGAGVRAAEGSVDSHAMLLLRIMRASFGVDLACPEQPRWGGLLGSVFLHAQ